MKNKIIENLCFGAKTWCSRSATGFVVYHGIIVESEPSQIKFPLSKYKKNKVKKFLLENIANKSTKEIFDFFEKTSFFLIDESLAQNIATALGK